MQIGLYTGAITSSQRVSGGGVSQTPEALAPIAGILDAPNIVILGASIMAGSFSDLQLLQDYAAAAGFSGTLWSEAQAGDKIDDTILRHAAAQSTPALSATEGQNVYIVHSGGNNVSGARPWPGQESQFANSYETLMQQITASGDTVIPLPLTKRLYTSAPVVTHGDGLSEENGSKPYNENLIYPAISTHAPDWRADGQAPYVNPYELADRYPGLLNSDGIHGYSNGTLACYILARVAARAMGLAKGRSRSGTSLLYSVERGAPKLSEIGTINRFLSYGNLAPENNLLLCGALTTAGAFDPFVEVRSNDQFQNKSNAAGTGTYARIPDTRFHDPTMVNYGVYVLGTQTLEMTFAGLTPGDVVTVSAIGVRNSGGTNRRGTLALSTGEALELDASNIAASNQVTFAPVAVPQDGRLSLSLSVAPGSTYGYLHGVLLDFA